MKTDRGKGEEEKITQETLEAKLREVADAVNATSQPAREAAWRIGLITAAFLVILDTSSASAGGADHAPTSKCGAAERN